MTKIRHILTIVALACYALASAHTYVSSSVLASGSFHKIQVSESGLYSLTFDELRKMGVDPASLRIYGYGGAMLKQNFTLPKIDDLPVVPYLRLDDRVVFYGQGSIAWEYNGSRFSHTHNPYSDYGYYFITSNAGAAEEISTSAAITDASFGTVTKFPMYLLHEVDSFNLIDWKTGNSGGGREFYGEHFRPGETRTFAFNFPSQVSTTDKATCNVELAANGMSSSTFNITSDGLNVTATAASIPSNEFYTRATAANKTQQYTPTATANKTVSITYNSSAATAVGFLNFIELTATCPLQMGASGEPLYFRTTTGYNTSYVLTFQIANATSATQVWDITQLDDIHRVPTTLSGSTLSFKATNNTIHQYVAFNPTTTTYHKPTDMGAVNAQNLHALSDIDMVIITPAEFLYEAQRLGAAHEQYDGMTVAVVTDQQVFNEFSSGTPDATAFRWLMKMLYDRANASGGTIKRPGYLLLFGDGSYDNRNLLYGASGSKWLLTYQAKNSLHEVKAYATDDYFVFLEDNEGDNDYLGTMDASVGRLPVNSTTQAQEVVDKLIRHMQTKSHGKWKTQLVFLADDDDHILHTQCADEGAEQVRLHNPDFVVNKIYLDAYTQEVSASGESYPLAEARLHNMIRTGVQLFDYCGHSGYNNATSEGLISSAIVRNMRNDNLGLWMFASCSFAHFDGLNTSAAEEAVLNPNGGALAVCSANRTVYAMPNATLNRHVCDSLFAHRDPFTYPHRIGDAIRLGKRSCGSDENKMSYVLLGDPASSLKLPIDYQVVTSSLADTLTALSIHTIEGYIRTPEGDTATFFNGPITFTIYDKLQQVSTLDNDEPDPDKKQTYTYNDHPNILFQGEAKVTNGRFSAEFMVPKDIRYNYGQGRIVFYAYDSEYGDEAIGHYEEMVIGGSSPVAIVDEEGPEMSLYLNSTSFADGDETSETPHFFADIYDEHGINTVGSGIGHDLLLVVDDKPVLTYVLNDYFTATQGYQSGRVSFAMSELSEGAHHLSFRAWDLLNNSTTSTLNFTVVKGLQPDIMSVTCYPNPVAAGDQLSIEVDHTAPDVIFDTDVFVYDLSGRLVHHQSQRGTEQIRWNIGSANTPAGMYFYKVQLSTEGTKTISKTGKLIITK